MRCVWQSIKPGRTVASRRSIILADSGTCFRSAVAAPTALDPAALHDNRGICKVRACADVENPSCQQQLGRRFRRRRSTVRLRSLKTEELGCRAGNKAKQGSSAHVTDPVVQQSNVSYIEPGGVRNYAHSIPVWPCLPALQTSSSVFRLRSRTSRRRPPETPPQLLLAARVLDIRAGSYLTDAAIVVEGGRIKAVGAATALRKQVPEVRQDNRSSRRDVLPGFDRLPHAPHGPN